MTRFAIVLPFAASLCAATGSAASAQSCADQITRLEQQYGLAPGSVRAGGTGQAMTDLAPPATIESRGLTETQPAPANLPQNGSSVPNPAAPPPPQIAARRRMREMLAEARDAEQRGDTAQCQDSVHAAEQQGSLLEPQR